MADEKETGVTSLDNNLSLHLFSKDILLSYHNYLKWKDMYNFIQTSNVALGYFNDLNLWRKSLRRKLLIESIPQYLNWPLRSKSEMIAIQKKRHINNDINQQGPKNLDSFRLNSVSVSLVIYYFVLVGYLKR